MIHYTECKEKATGGLEELILQKSCWESCECNFEREKKVKNAVLFDISG